jgi:hypothetical protein
MSDPLPPRRGRNSSRRDFVGRAALLSIGVVSGAFAGRGSAQGPRSEPSATGGPEVSVHQWDAAGTNDVNDGPRINRALEEAPLGCTLVFPPGVYRTAITLLQRRQLNIRFEPGAAILGVLPSDQMNLWDVRVEQAVLGNGDVRRMRFDNVTLEVALGTACNNVFNVENARPQIGNLGMLVMNCRMAGLDDQRGAAVRIAGINTQLHSFLHNEIVNQIHLDGAADACRFVYNLISGHKTAFLIDLSAGAFRTLIAHNVLVARDGAMLVRNGSQVDFLHNQVEQTASYGANRSRLRSAVMINPQAYRSRQINLIGNNFGAGELVATSLHIEGGSAGCEDIFIDGNMFGVTASRTDIKIADGRVRGTRIGPNNLVRGPRDRAQFTIYPEVAENRLDPADLLVVDDNGGGTYGARKSAAALGLRNGWASGDLRFWKTLDDELVFAGVLRGGSAAPNTPVGTLPEGFRPARDTVLLVPTEEGTAASLAVGADGVVSVLRAPTPCILHLTGVRLAVQGRSSYAPGH